MNAWDSLPNSKHIERILASLASNKKEWIKAGKTVTGIEINDAIPDNATHAQLSCWFSIIEIVERLLWDDYAISDGDYSNDKAVLDAIIALIYFESSADLLNEEPGRVLTMAFLGDKNAMLMYRACAVLTSIKN